MGELLASSASSERLAVDPLSTREPRTQFKSYGGLNPEVGSVGGPAKQGDWQCTVTLRNYYGNRSVFFGP